MAFKRRLKFDNRIKFKKKMSIMYILLFVVLASLGVGYSYIKSDLNINGSSKIVGATWDVHFANLNVTSGSVTAEIEASITDTTTVGFAATLENPNDYYEFTVDVVNNGTMDAMIDSFNISPTLTTAQQKYLEYQITYSDGAPLVNKQELKVNTTETLKVKFKYKTNSDTANYPTEDQTFTVAFTVAYTQADGSEIEVEHIPAPESFTTDSWATIVTAVQSDNTSNYSVGDTKEVDLGTLGTHTLRIANKSTPAECSTTGFSQTACGFVLEFADIVTTHNMNSTGTNVGGWPASEMRDYVSTDIYNALPEVLKNAIIDTTVVSGHGSTTGETNFTSTDKLYLLSTHEVWEDVEGNTSSGIDYSDTAYANTRQLDYYLAQGVTTSNYSGAIKQRNGSNYYCWLRSAFSSDSYPFYYVNDTGAWSRSNARSTYGVSPAFRIA